MMNEQLLKVLISFGAIGIALAFLRINNNRRIKRALQFPFLVFTPLLMIAEIVLLMRFRSELYQLLNQIPFLQSILQTLLSGTGIFYGVEVLFGNVLLIIPYFVAKLLLRPLFALITRKFAKNVIRKWYDPDLPKGIYLLKNSQINVRSLWGALMLSLGFCVAVICAVNWLVGSGNIFWLNFYPAAAWVVIGEFYWFIAGVTKEEYSNQVDGENVIAAEHSDYGKLKNVLESIFPEPFLTGHTGKEYSDRIGSGDYLHQLLESENKEERLAASFFLHLPGKKEGSFDVDLIKACVNLMHNQSTVIFNPFYHDLDDYLTLPFMNTLLAGRKILVICGRQSMTEDVSAWLQSLLNDYCRTDALWNIGMLDANDENDVGILSFSNLYDPNIINGKGEFFSQVGFVLLIELSRMLSTAQAGLGIVVGKLNQMEKPVICAIDREADGLVDLLSHLFLQNVTNVVAAPPIMALYSLIGWDATGDYHRQTLFQQQTHFLGNGTELAATALKYQIPEVSWYSEEKAPVHDLRWISGQYYRQICSYAGIPNSQEALDLKIHFVSNPLDSRLTERAFLITEDECCNLYAIARSYLTRASKDIFINVLSENYLLRDYMRYNWRLFMNDAKAIPLITPHYAKTERNTVLRLVILMSGEPVREEYIRHELQMLGYQDTDVYGRISSLITKYLGVSHTIISVTNQKEFSIEDIPIPILYYQIPRKRFDTEFSKTLRNAFFVVEDEKLEKEHIDARMFQHITQMVMPGQQIVHGGKLYSVHKVSPDVGCILHRAADLYMKRLYYRQFRTYQLYDRQVTRTKQRNYSCEVISHRIINDMDITILSMDFSVSSTGYLEMTDQHDLRTAKKVDLSQDPSIEAGNYRRNYKNKSVMKLKLKDTSINSRYTISLILSEILKTIFPYSWPFVAILAEKPVDPDGMLSCVTYDLAGERDKEAIYILEDSVMDLGLLEAIDQNLFRLFETMADYLNWHAEKIMEPPQKDPVAIKPLESKKSSPSPKVSIFKKMRNGIAALFKGKKKAESAGDQPSDEKEQAKTAEETQKEPILETTESGKEETVAPDIVQETAASPQGNEQTQKPDDKDKTAVDAAAVPGDADRSGAAKTDDASHPEEPAPKSKYEKTCFLKFGYSEIDPAIAIDEVRSFLNAHGFGDNSLYRARKPRESGKPEIESKLVCDFCGLPLTGVQHDRLEDGRIRCGRCSASAVNSVEVFRDLFQDTLTLLKENFRITFQKAISVQVVDAKKMGHLSGVLFKPTAAFDSRVMGLAVHHKDEYAVYVENGSPRLETISTMAHELTHIWQYQNWDKKKILSIYKKKNELLVYEGMAAWVQIQILYILGEFTYASDQEALLNSREDIYGLAFRMYVEKYGMNRDGTVSARNPFNVFPPL